MHVAASALMENLALLKPTTQSGQTHLARLAVDGDIQDNFYGDIQGNLCADTGDRVYPWWTVDLLRQIIVTHVSVITCGKKRVKYGIIPNVYTFSKHISS